MFLSAEPKMSKSFSKRMYWTSCCICFHVRTGTILLGLSYLVMYAVTVTFLLAASISPEQIVEFSKRYNIPGSNYSMADGVDTSIAVIISFVMITISVMLIYGAWKYRPAWIVPFFCYQLFDFALTCLITIGFLTYLPWFKDYVKQLPEFSYREDIRENATWVVLVAVLFFAFVLTFKLYFICAVWNCYKFALSRNTPNVSVHTDQWNEHLLPPYEMVVVKASLKDNPPPYSSA
uniref:Lysosomal protein transmembrane 4 beta n=1 Tax=Eptatretus burgeri TaxID=7764 RepID=A0A8C4WV65_EPTBU